MIIIPDLATAAGRGDSGAPATFVPDPVEPRRKEPDFEVTLELADGYRQSVDFGLPLQGDWTIDEPEPIGAGTGPNPVRVLASAVGSCLAASLAFALRKMHMQVDAVHTTVSGELVRNERGRLRIGRMHVLLEPEVSDIDQVRYNRCLGMFEDYCIVTATVRQAFDVEVEVSPRAATAPA